MRLSASASAPGKAILFGEHAVVYGIPAIAAALSDLRILVNMNTNDSNALSVIFEDIIGSDGNPILVTISLERIREIISTKASDLTSPERPDEKLVLLLKTEFQEVVLSAGQGMMALTYLVGNLLVTSLQLHQVGLEIKIKSHGLPIGAGLGSSAAFSVASSAACLQLYHKFLSLPFDTVSNKNLQWINTWAFLAEVLIHGTPSGLDNTTSTYGGMLKFIKGENNQNHYENLLKIPKLQILLTNTKVPRSTKELVSSVRRLYESFSTVISPIFKSIEEITLQFMQLLEKSEKGELSEQDIEKKTSELMAINHHLLNAIGVGHPALTNVVDVSNQSQCACKLTGAGGGGCAITLVKTGADTEALSEKLRQLGYDVFQSSIGGEGVKIF